MKKNHKPIVSIITPCFNPDSNLINAIKSVQRQTFSSYEHIVIDDCSSADLVEEFSRYMSNDPKIRFIHRNWNAGAAVTRNRGISEAKGRFIAFLDADDMWHPQKLEKQIEFMLNENLALSYSAYEVINTRGDIIGVRTPPEQLTYDDLLKSNRIGCLTAIYDTSKLGKMYMPNILKRQDLGLWLKILKKERLAKGIINTPLAQYRVGCKSLSSNKLSVLKYQWRIYREVEHLSIVNSAKYFLFYAFYGIFKKY